ncbi:hypothetical protein DYB34_010820, partial [Aphanomyces astaci]
KTASRANLCMFLGHSEVKKAYKVYDLEDKKTVFTVDCTFKKTEFHRPRTVFIEDSDDQRDGKCGTMVQVTKEDVHMDLANTQPPLQRPASSMTSERGMSPSSRKSSPARLMAQPFAHYPPQVTRHDTRNSRRAAEAATEAAAATRQHTKKQQLCVHAASGWSPPDRDNYVDDVLVCTSNDDEITDVFEHLQRRIRLNDLGPISKLFGIEIDRHEKSKSICTRAGQDTQADGEAALADFAGRVRACMLENSINIIYNADQTGVNYEHVPTNMINTRSECTIWVKCGGKCKERATALVLTDSPRAKYPLFLVLKTAAFKIKAIVQENLTTQNVFIKQVWKQVEPHYKGERIAASI